MAEAARIREIFDEAIELSGGDRAGYLDRTCAGDAGLRRRVEELLAAAEKDDAFLASPTGGAPDLASAASAPLSEGPGTTIGPYKLLQQIGEGGFGSVFMAEQQSPVVRRVALKIIKWGMDTRQVIARFEAERQALAMMDHANIAKVLDAGATEAGRPYFVMDLVKGDPITAYCDTHNLSVEDRLGLFGQVCNAVQHAHQKGIIHRDIKPSNVLVTVADGKPVPKVIDFGIAKATLARLTEKTLFTEHRALIGTPEYMSPEQAEMTGVDIDTRSDIYSLGVLLYELLTGALPFDSKRLRSAAFGEIQRIIREEDPPNPSTRLSTLETIASVAANRHTEPARLSRQVRGDLDWIVMKALEKDRTRRYETASGLGADVQRHLSGEPVVAAPPSTGYRVRKFVKRNRAQVIAVGIVAGALVLGVVGTTGGMIWALNEKDRANAERAKATLAAQSEAEQRMQADAARAEALAQEAKAKEQEVEARKQAAIAEAVAKFQTDMLGAADPQKLLGDKVTVVQAMEAAVNELDKGSLKDQPLVEAGVRDTIGRTLQELGRYDDAEPNLRKSLAIRRAAHPAGHPGIAAGLNNLASLLQNQNKPAEAEPLLREAVAINRAALPAGHPNIAAGLNSLAVLLMAQNKLAEAEPLYGEALQIARAALPAGHPDIASGLNNLAWLLQAQNKLAEAEPLFREAVAINRAALPAGHPKIAIGLDNLASLLRYQNKLAEAEPLYREVLAIRRAALPAGHPDIATGLNNLALLLKDQNKLAEAEPLYREALAIWRAALPAGHPDIAAGLNNLALLLRDQNKLAEAEPLFREALAIRRAALPAGHPDIATGLNNLATLLRDQNKLAEAEPLFREAVEIYRAALPAGHPDIASGLSNLAGLLQDQNKLAEAEPLYREALAISRAALPAGHPNIAFDLSNLAGLLRDQNKLAEAEPLVREALAIFRAALPAGHPEIAAALNNLAWLLQNQNKLAEAEPLVREAVAINRAALPAGHPNIAAGLSNFARVQQGLGQTAEARAGWDEAIAMLRQVSPNGSPLLARVLGRSGGARLENKDAAAALPELEEAVAMGEKFLPPDHPQLKEYRETLGKCKAALAEQGKPDAKGGGG